MRQMAGAGNNEELVSTSSRRNSQGTQSAYGSGAKAHKHLRGQNNMSMTSKQTSSSGDEIEDPDSLKNDAGPPIL